MALTDKELRALREARLQQEVYVNDAAQRLVEIINDYVSAPALGDDDEEDGEYGNNVLCVTVDNCEQLELTLPSYVHAQHREIAMLKKQLRSARAERDAVKGVVKKKEFDRLTKRGDKIPAEHYFDSLVATSEDYNAANDHIGDLEEALACAEGFLEALRTVKEILPGVQGLRNRNS